MFERLLGKRTRQVVPPVPPMLPGPPVPMVLYTRPGCHLCDVMKADIAAAGLRTPYELVEVDIDRDRELKRRYGLAIPVLEIAGEQAFEGRLERGELRQVFDRRAAEWQRRGDAPR